jgi:hypothetical protein
MLQMAKAALSGMMGGNQTPGNVGALSPLTDPGLGHKAVGFATATDFVFPEDLGTQNYFVEFMCVQRTRKKRTDSHKETTKGSVFLPLPPNLGDVYQANYDQTSLGLVGESGRGMGGAMANLFANGMSLQAIKDADYNAMLKQTTQFAKEFAASEGVKTLSNPAAMAAIVAKVTPSLGGFGDAAGAVAGAAAGQSARGALVGEGAAVNPFLAQVFTGVNLRSHTFEFKLFPKNKKESQTLRELIHHFKKGMHPSHELNGSLGRKMQNFVGAKAGTPGSRAFFSYPDEWRIQFSPNVAANLYNIKPCVMTNFGVNYHGEGKAFYHENLGALGGDGGYEASPAIVTISMSFSETEVVTKEDLDTAGQDNAAIKGNSAGARAEAQGPMPIGL